MNHENRLEWGFGPGQSLRYRYDNSIPNVQLSHQLVSFERFFGAVFRLETQYNQFAHQNAPLLSLRVQIDSQTVQESHRTRIRLRASDMNLARLLTPGKEAAMEASTLHGWGKVIVGWELGV